MNKTTGISNGMAKWIEDFVEGLSKNKLQKKAEEENATIDTNTTPDTSQETVPCDPNANPETVDYFNQPKTAAINVFDLPKVVWNDETFYVLFDQETGKATILNQFANVVTTIAATTIEEVDDALNSLQVVTSAIDDSDKLNDNEQINSNNIIDQNNSNNIINNEENYKDDIINQMQEKINNLTEQVNILQQQYARTTELQNLDIGAEEAEIQHFNETAIQTQQQINEDNSKDITTPRGRSTLRERLLNDIDDTINEINTDETVVDDQLNNNVELETQSESKSDDIDLTNNDAKSIDFETPNVVNEQLYMEDSEEKDTKLDNFSSEDETTEENEEFEVLNGKDANIFKKAVCPCCGGDLVKVNRSKSFQGIICKGNCKSEYAVNLDNETIFKKRGAK